MQPSALAAIPPHLLIQDAFGAATARRLLAFALASEGRFAETTVSRQNIDNKQIRRSRRIRDFGELQDELHAKFMALLPHAMTTLRLAPFSVHHLSMELVAHGDGDFYQRHIDTFVSDEKAASDRILTGVYYFHASPKAFTGGALRLHSISPAEAGGGYVDIEPPNDSLLLFPAWAPHEVCRISCPSGDFAQSRFAINCWYNGMAA